MPDDEDAAHDDEAASVGADGAAWSAVAADWAELWGGFAGPARLALVAAARIGAGSRVLDVGCGSGELLALVAGLGADAAGIDPASGMVDLARSRVPDADVRLGSAERLPWADGTFDVVTAVNALELADDVLEALAEAVRVAVPGGRLGIAGWAEGARNDLDVVELAVAHAAGEEPQPDGALRLDGGLERLLAHAGLDVVSAGLVEAVWQVSDDATLIRGILLGEDAPGLDARAATVVAAARPFRTAHGGYRLLNAFRYAVARTAGGGHRSVVV